mmetsp:Transcript_29321/g.74575  ORF Transcript_29321/g.74575 Transcript_29321/m.74575 type:complete len:209 (+) Transcript_29321:396-1022(+)
MMFAQSWDSRVGITCDKLDFDRLVLHQLTQSPHTQQSTTAPPTMSTIMDALAALAPDCVESSMAPAPGGGISGTVVVAVLVLTDVLRSLPSTLSALPAPLRSPTSSGKTRTSPTAIAPVVAASMPKTFATAAATIIGRRELRPDMRTPRSSKDMPAGGEIAARGSTEPGERLKSTCAAVTGAPIAEAIVERRSVSKRALSTASATSWS